MLTVLNSAKSANIVYCTLIRPILEYCVSVWGCCGVGHKQDLEALYIVFYLSYY